jgi:tetratricopeptide (TPR) repeat protein
VWSSIPDRGRTVASALEQLGQLRVRRGDPAGAREAFLRASRAAGGAPPTESALPFSLAQVERLLGDIDHADALEREAEHGWAGVPDPLDVHAAGTSLTIAGILSSQGRAAAAEPFFRRAQQGLRAALGEESAATADTTLRLATAIHDQGKLDEAAAQYRAALRAFRRLGGDEHPDVGTCLFRLAQIAAADTDRDGLLLLRAEAERLRRASAALAADHPHRSGAALLSGYVALALGDAAAAEAPLRECVAIRLATLAEGHRLTAYAQTVLGGRLVMQGRADEARAVLPDAVARVRAGYGPGSLMTAEAESRLAALGLAESAGNR